MYYKITNKESENEKTRKTMLYVIKQLDENTTICGRKYDYQKWISWLEKQGSIGKMNEKLRQYREYLVKETERWHKNEEDETLSKIGKQDCIGHANAYISARSEFEDLFNYDSWLEKQGEQKAMKPITDEWTEEDERICRCLIKDQKEAIDKVNNSESGHSEIISELKEMYREYINWLESIKLRMKGE